MRAECEYRAIIHLFMRILTKNYVPHKIMILYYQDVKFFFENINEITKTF